MLSNCHQMSLYNPINSTKWLCITQTDWINHSIGWLQCSTQQCLHNCQIIPNTYCVVHPSTLELWAKWLDPADILSFISLCRGISSRCIILEGFNINEVMLVTGRMWRMMKRRRRPLFVIFDITEIWWWFSKGTKHHCFLNFIVWLLR